MLPRWVWPINTTNKIDHHSTGKPPKPTKKSPKTVLSGSLQSKPTRSTNKNTHAQHKDANRTRRNTQTEHSTRRAQKPGRLRRLLGRAPCFRSLRLGQAQLAQERPGGFVAHGLARSRNAGDANFGRGEADAAEFCWAGFPLFIKSHEGKSQQLGTPWLSEWLVPAAPLCRMLLWIKVSIPARAVDSWGYMCPITYLSMVV